MPRPAPQPRRPPPGSSARRAVGEGTGDGARAGGDRAGRPGCRVYMTDAAHGGRYSERLSIYY